MPPKKPAGPGASRAPAKPAARPAAGRGAAAKKPGGPAARPGAKPTAAGRGHTQHDYSGGMRPGFLQPYFWLRRLRAISYFGYSSLSRAGRLGRTLWPQNSTSVAETEKGGQNSTMTPPTLEKGGSIFYITKVCKKRGSKIYNSKKYRGQNSTSLKMGVKILHAEK